MSGLRTNAMPRTPPRSCTGERPLASKNLLQPPVLIVSPSRSKVYRKRKSSISQELNPIVGLKSPTRNARSSLTEKRFFNFNPTSFGTAINFLRRPRTKPAQKPIPTLPLPPIPYDNPSVPSTPKKSQSSLTPSSPTMPDAVYMPSNKNATNLRKRSMDRIPKLRLKTPGIFNSRSGPLSAPFNSRTSSSALSPDLISPEFIYSNSTIPSANNSTSTIHTPLSAPFNFSNWGVGGVKDIIEEDEESHDNDIEMN